MMFKVVEMFISINGEGTHSGQLAFFVRFAGCNLNCSFCDTKWANEENVSYTLMSADDIYNKIKASGIKNVTLTGGEPLLRDGIYELLTLLSKDKELYIEIETNGSIDLMPFMDIDNRPSMTMDYKLPFSNMESYMNKNNLSLLGKNDTVKFVCANKKDLDRAKEIIDKYELTKHCNVYLSPVFGEINPDTMVEYMKDNLMNDVTLQLQMHKVIWDPNARGV
ncbi:MAG: putative 7-carboxy-7-deazaguanine synthase QueE [Lachnospiraceae bacterium]|nr:putative 7-carboxy-7-deazaguanine synthase QueE [Lachnospiraceae bacterium]